MPPLAGVNHSKKKKGKICILLYINQLLEILDLLTELLGTFQNGGKNLLLTAIKF